MKTMKQLVKGIQIEYGCQEKEGGGFGPVVVINGEKALVDNVVFATQDEAIANAKEQLIIAAKAAIVLFNKQKSTK